MPVSRAYINQFALGDSNQFQALNDLANFVDALESAMGVRIAGGAAGANAAPAPPAASMSVSAGNGHFSISITSAASSATQAPVQHQIASATTTAFDSASSPTTYTLGVGETTRDIVDPGVTKYWRIRSRYAGSNWNTWQMYATAAGVVGLSSGTLKTG